MSGGRRNLASHRRAGQGGSAWSHSSRNLHAGHAVSDGAGLSLLPRLCGREERHGFGSQTSALRRQGHRQPKRHQRRHQHHRRPSHGGGFTHQHFHQGALPHYTIYLQRSHFFGQCLRTLSSRSRRGRTHRRLARSRRVLRLQQLFHRQRTPPLLLHRLPHPSDGTCLRILLHPTRPEPHGDPLQTRTPGHWRRTGLQRRPRPSPRSGAQRPLHRPGRGAHLPHRREIGGTGGPRRLQRRHGPGCHQSPRRRRGAPRRSPPPSRGTLPPRIAPHPVQLPTDPAGAGGLSSRTRRQGRKRPDHPKASDHQHRRRSHHAGGHGLRLGCRARPPRLRGGRERTRLRRHRSAPAPHFRCGASLTLPTGRRASPGAPAPSQTPEGKLLRALPRCGQRALPPGLPLGKRRGRARREGADALGRPARRAGGAGLGLRGRRSGGTGAVAKFSPGRDRVGRGRALRHLGTGGSGRRGAPLSRGGGGPAGVAGPGGRVGTHALWTGAADGRRNVAGSGTHLRDLALRARGGLRGRSGVLGRRPLRGGRRHGGGTHGVPPGRSRG
mmetsp:Transcript_25023/g.57834  ORF Transcript_25023/g.57834 Transcript_25023/m.57834 type:complete len:554 (-) Transcript_25023:2345-4006(-)